MYNPAILDNRFKLSEKDYRQLYIYKVKFHLNQKNIYVFDFSTLRAYLAGN